MPEPQVEYSAVGVTRPVTARRNVTFGAACRGCPLRACCTTSKHGRALILHEHDALRAERAHRRGDHEEALRQLTRWSWGYWLIVLVLVIATWDMVIKPGQ